MALGPCLRVLAAFAATFSFALIFGAPKKELVFCGICGGVCVLFWELSVNHFASDLMPTFIAGVAAAFASRFFAVKRQNPASVYLIAGIIPLAPGASLYYSMYNVLIGDGALAAWYGVNTIKIAGVLCLAIITVLSLPYQFFGKREIFISHMDQS